MSGLVRREKRTPADESINELLHRPLSELNSMIAYQLERANRPRLVGDPISQPGLGE